MATGRAVQRTLSEKEALPAEARQAHESTSTFHDNLSAPVHRWFRYPAGFSSEWVERLVRQWPTGSPRVFDPFVGSGTTLLACQRAGAESIGVESHPFVSRITAAKLLWDLDPGPLLALSSRVLRGSHSITVDRPAPLLAKCYPANTLAKLQGLKFAIDSETEAGPYRPLLWVALVSVLRRCSPVGTAPWQYVLPSKRKSHPADPVRAFADQIEMMAADMRVMRDHATGASATLYEEDARVCSSIPSSWADLVVTSPPYPNNYDYADATRLEMTFFGEIGGWTDLQATVRNRLVHSCSQHVVDFDIETALASPLLRPISEELRTVYDNLSRERLVHGGRKAYNSMVVAYFLDLAQVWTALRRVTKPGGRVCFVIGDSAPYGIHIPVERWLGELSVSAGFRGFEFEKLRDRNTKWLNRKHRVPLQEGRLWVEA